MEQETEQYLSQLAVQAYSVITFRHNYHGQDGQSNSTPETCEICKYAKLS